MNEYIKSDLYRYYGKDDFITFVKGYLLNRTFRFQYALRMCQTSGLSRYYGLLLWRLNRTKRIIQIPRNTKVGYGLYIGHGGPVVIHPTTVIGDNCNLSQFTSIGSNENHAAVIGNNTYIGPNVSIECFFSEKKFFLEEGRGGRKKNLGKERAGGNYAKK